MEHLEVVTRDVRLRADYDEPYLEWLFRELDMIGCWGPLWPDGVGGAARAEVVSRGGVVDGWYVCQLRIGGFCRVLQFAATARGAEVVFAQLAHRARERGAAGLYGRLEPRLAVPVTARSLAIRPSEVACWCTHAKGGVVHGGSSRRCALDPPGWRVVVRPTNSLPEPCSTSPATALTARRARA